MNYYVMRTGRTFGPYSLADLQRYVRTADISVNDMAQPQGSADWIPVGQIVNGVEVLASPAPPQPVQPPMHYGYTPPQPWNYYAPRPRNRASFILLGVFFGCFGAHNFYAGYKGKAVAQLCITLCSLFTLSIVTAIWAIVEVCTIDRDRTNVPMI